MCNSTDLCLSMGSKRKGNPHNLREGGCRDEIHTPGPLLSLTEEAAKQCSQASRMTKASNPREEQPTIVSREVVHACNPSTQGVDTGGLPRR